MKRVFLFAGETYYPSGGMSDYRGAFDSIEEAKAALDREDWEWGQIAELTDEGLVCGWWWTIASGWYYKRVEE